MPFFKTIKTVPPWYPNFQTTDGSVNWDGDYDATMWDDDDDEHLMFLDSSGEWYPAHSLYKCLCKAYGLASHVGAEFNDSMDGYPDQEEITDKAAELAGRKSGEADRGSKLDKDGMKMKSANAIRNSAAKVTVCLSNYMQLMGENKKLLDADRATATGDGYEGAGGLTGKSMFDIVDPSEEGDIWGTSEYITGYRSGDTFVKRGGVDEGEGEGYAEFAALRDRGDQTFLTYAAGEMDFILDEDMFNEEAIVSAPSKLLKITSPYEPV
jgi:hypothetical protein